MKVEHEKSTGSVRPSGLEIVQPLPLGRGFVQKSTRKVEDEDADGHRLGRPRLVQTISKRKQEESPHFHESQPAQQPLLGMSSGDLGKLRARLGKQIRRGRSVSCGGSGFQCQKQRPVNPGSLGFFIQKQRQCLLHQRSGACMVMQVQGQTIEGCSERKGSW